MSDLSQLRKHFERQGLSKSDLAADPFEQFQAWFDLAVTHSPGSWFEVNAMSLATSSASEQVTCRTVLLKHHDSNGFVFFSNYESEKGRALGENPYASLLFHWSYMGRQIRINGRVEKTSEEMSREYFQSRPRGAQIGAWASNQSQVLQSRVELENKTREVEERFEGQEVIPLPNCWGGYRLIPASIEFWQGRSNRLHDRLRYRLTASGKWILERLSP